MTALILINLLAADPTKSPRPEDLDRLKFPGEAVADRQAMLWGSYHRAFHVRWLKETAGRALPADLAAEMRRVQQAGIYWDTLAKARRPERENAAKYLPVLYKMIGREAYEKGWHPPVWNGVGAPPKFDWPKPK